MGVVLEPRSIVAVEPHRAMTFRSADSSRCCSGSPFLIANRARTIFAVTPPSRVWVFSERITFYPIGFEVKGTGTTAYAWYVWDKDASSKNEVRWFMPAY